MHRMVQLKYFPAFNRGVKSLDVMCNDFKSGRWGFVLAMDQR